MKILTSSESEIEIDNTNRSDSIVNQKRSSNMSKGQDSKKESNERSSNRSGSKIIEKEMKSQQDLDLLRRDISNNDKNNQNLEKYISKMKRAKLDHQHVAFKKESQESEISLGFKELDLKMRKFIKKHSFEKRMLDEIGIDQKDKNSRESGISGQIRNSKTDNLKKKDNHDSGNEENVFEEEKREDILDMLGDSLIPMRSLSEVWLRERSESPDERNLRDFKYSYMSPIAKRNVK